MQERRKYPRTDLYLFSNVYDSKSERMIGTLLNLTLEGAMVLSDARVESDQVMELHIKLPEGLSHKNELVLRAKSRWCAPDINPEFYDVGYQFADVSVGDAQIIKAVIDRYGYKE